MPGWRLINTLNSTGQACKGRHAKSRRLPDDPSADPSLIGETKYMYAIRELKLDFGLQYTIPLDKKRAVTLGAVYTPKINASADVNPSEMLYAADPYENPWTGASQVLKTDTLYGAGFQLPHTFGLGLTYNTDHFLIGLDGTYQLWKNLAYPALLDDLTDDTRFNDAFRINTGMEYVIDRLSQNFFHRIRFRGGFSFANSYTNFSVNNPDSGEKLGMGSFREYGVNVGLGLPFHDYMTGHVSMLNIGFGYSRQQPDSDFMISQDMFKISINMNINEFWFFKRQFN